MRFKLCERCGVSVPAGPGVKCVCGHVQRPPGPTVAELDGVTVDFEPRTEADPVADRRRRRARQGW